MRNRAAANSRAGKAVPRSTYVPKRFHSKGIKAGAIALSFFLAPAAWAQAQDSKWTLGARAGLAIPTESLNGFTGTKPDTGLMLNLDLAYRLRSNIHVGGSVEYQNNKMPSISGPGTGNGSFGDSSINVATVLAFAQYRLNRSGNVTPYGLAGIGVNFNWMGDDKAGNSFDVDPSLALKFGVGADYFISKKTALNIEAGYKLNNSSVTRNPGGQSFDFNLSTFYLLGGVRFAL